MPGASPGGTSQPTTYIEAMAAEAKAEEQAEREKAGLEGGWGAELAAAKAEFEPGRERSGGQGGQGGPRTPWASAYGRTHLRTAYTEYSERLPRTILNFLCTF